MLSRGSFADGTAVFQDAAMRDHLDIARFARKFALHRPTFGAHSQSGSAIDFRLPSRLTSTSAAPRVALARALWWATQCVPWIVLLAFLGNAVAVVAGSADDRQQSIDSLLAYLLFTAASDVWRIVGVIALTNVVMSLAGTARTHASHERDPSSTLLAGR